MEQTSTCPAWRTAKSYAARMHTSRAEAPPGVFAVVTAADLPSIEGVAAVGEGGDVNLRHSSENTLARNKALYHGHAIAAVSAINAHVAAEAVKLIEVEYELLPPVMDVRKAMEPDATL